LDEDEAKRLKGLEVENAKLKKLLAEALLANEAIKEVLAKKMVTPDQRREAVAHVQAKGLSGRAACRWTGLSRIGLRYVAQQPALDQARLKQMRETCHAQPRFGYRRVGILVGLSFKIAWRLWKTGRSYGAARHTGLCALG
jgi:hypothetical protein